MQRVAIPGGVWRDGVSATEAPLRELPLRAVGAEDDAFLLELADDSLPSRRATALLERCLEDARAAETAHALTVGDREALLLHLRRLTLGETFDCVVQCPEEPCGELMELILRVNDLLVPAYDDVRREYEIEAFAEGAQYTVSFRLPTAGDLDGAAALARSDPERSAQWLFERCVVRATRGDDPVSCERLGTGVREAVSAAMAERDPQAEIELALACPTCGSAFSVVFDTALFFLQELDQRAAQLMHDVHTLAWHYHWSERDILDMPRKRRAHYLGLVAEAVAQSRGR